MGLSIPGSGLVKKAIQAGGDVARSAAHLPGEAVRRAGMSKRLPWAVSKTP